jgi:hypothetical protein
MRGGARRRGETERERARDDDGTTTGRWDSIGDGIGGVNAIPLGMERSVENHPHHQTRHSVGMTPERVWAHS